MSVSWWGDQQWDDLVALCREDGIDLPADEIRECAESFRRCGTDGGGNQYGIVGTAIATNVERLVRAHNQGAAQHE